MKNEFVIFLIDATFFTLTQEHAASMGESMNAFVIRAITEAMNRDRQKQE